MVTSQTIKPPVPSWDQDNADLAEASVLELVLMRVRLRCRRRAAWLAHLWGGSIAEGYATFEATVQASLDDRDTLEAESFWFETAEEVQLINDKLGKVEQALAGDAGAGLAQLAEMFRLSQPEMDLLQACLAPAVDPSVGTVYGYLQHHAGRNYATEPLAARLFGSGRRAMWGPSCPLARWGFVTAGDAASGEQAALTVDPIVSAWLQGEMRIDAALAGLVRMIQPRKPLESWPVAEAIRLLQRGLAREATLRLAVVGPPSSGRRTFCGCGCRALWHSSGCRGDGRGRGRRLAQPLHARTAPRGAGRFCSRLARKWS